MEHLDVYQAAGRPVDAEAESALRLELENGSRIVSLPGTEKTIRGYSGARLLAVDEAARVPVSLFLAVLPMLAVSGRRLALLSTPFGNKGFFADSWRERQCWHAIEVPATACPRISPAFLAEMEAKMGWYWFQQEFMCALLDSETAAFRREDIDRAFSEDVEVWDLAS